MNRRVLDKQGLQHLVDKIYEHFTLRSSFFKGSEEEWNALTDEEKRNIIFAAVIESDFTLTPAEENDLTTALGEDVDITVDMTLEEALTAALEIAGERD